MAGLAASSRDRFFCEKRNILVDQYRVTGKYSELKSKGGVERRLQHSLIRNVTWNRALRRDALRLLPHGE